MNTTGIFETTQYDIVFEHWGETHYVVPFGDVHRSSPHHCKKAWGKFLSWAVDKPRAHFLGMGDYDDFLSSSERRSMLVGGFHDSTVKTLNDLMVYHTLQFMKDIEFMRGKLIGLKEGNHYGVLDDGSTTTMTMCKHLGTKYLGVVSLIRIRFIYKPPGSARATNKITTIDIFAHHGKGSARLLGGSLNKVQHMSEIAQADIYLQGHDHKKMAAFGTRLELGRMSKNDRQPPVREKKVLYARTGSFLTAYKQGESSYVANALLGPADLGVVKIELTPKRKEDHGREYSYVDIHCSV
jgi:hypothetical protein